MVIPKDKIPEFIVHKSIPYHYRKNSDWLDDSLAPVTRYDIGKSKYLTFDTQVNIEKYPVTPYWLQPGDRLLNLASSKRVIGDVAIVGIQGGKILIGVKIISSNFTPVDTGKYHFFSEEGFAKQWCLLNEEESLTLVQ